MLKTFLILLLLCLSLTSYSQSSKILKGNIEADSLEGSFINIVNITKEIGSVNHENGEFEIEVSENDTLYFSSVQYEVKEVVVSREIMEMDHIEVNLVPNVNELEEVRISNISLSGNLQRDLANIKTFNQLDVGIPYPAKARLGSVDRKLYTASSGSISLLLNLMNGNLKMLKKTRENQQLANLVDRGINSLPLSVFVEDFDIPEEHVINFVYFCAEDPDFGAIVYNEQPLRLFEYYQGKVKYFLTERMGN